MCQGHVKDVSKLAKGNMLLALLVNNRSRLNLIPTYMHNPAVALRDTMIELEVAIEGGKDSLSMAAQAGGETVKAPGNLVISQEVVLLHITVGTGKGRLGGLALAQFFDQLQLWGLLILAWTLKYLKRAFNATQTLKYPLHEPDTGYSILPCIDAVIAYIFEDNST
ncbi:hypothetical protein SELMODRAFT_406584 [Selaginella moellendorffii]|uniref:Uncharacterized protein n=1 Tax=Selaginella moellendorffii TaxID=88036 RepID=D8R0T6_SELML|nr:hypothetical protein SELMODRAFT_406584 [Selaginella moellendorffii]